MLMKYRNLNRTLTTAQLMAIKGGTPSMALSEKVACGPANPCPHPCPNPPSVRGFQCIGGACISVLC